MLLVATLTLLALSLAAPEDPDTDCDGLSDFHEQHKYFTDPREADSDGDGVPDGEWNERREYAYTVRTLVQVAPPVTDDVLCDDYQDARVLERGKDCVELEVIHYPLNTVGETLAADPRWRERARTMTAWTAPGPTANWDEAMRRELVAALARVNIDVAEIDDLELVQRAARWLVDHARSNDGFSTFCSTFVDGKAAVLPGLEAEAERGKSESGLSLEQQWERELFARGMFAHAVRGTCTSSAIYLNGCLRALGIPTRIVLCIPAIDGSDAREIEMARQRLTHPGVRRIVVSSGERAGNSWTSHTFNEVFVGGRWRRLNYARLGQNVLDAQCLGLMTHVATFSDWADGEMARTWGVRQASADHASDVFGFANPYSTLSISDRFGEHAREEPELLLGDREHRALTVERLYWYDSPERKVEMRLDDPDTAGHLLAHVRENVPGAGTAQYEPFYGACDKRFTLRAPGHPDVPLRAARGYWVQDDEDTREFYLRIEPADFQAMAQGVAYTLSPRNDDASFRWEISGSVGVVRNAR